MSIKKLKCPLGLDCTGISELKGQCRNLITCGAMAGPRSLQPRYFFEVQPHTLIPFFNLEETDLREVNGSLFKVFNPWAKAANFKIVKFDAYLSGAEKEAIKATGFAEAVPF